MFVNTPSASTDPLNKNWNILRLPFYNYNVYNFLDMHKVVLLAVRHQIKQIYNKRKRFRCFLPKFILIINLLCLLKMWTASPENNIWFVWWTLLLLYFILTSSFTHAIITSDTRGRHLMMDINMGHKKLLSLTTYDTILSRRTGW